MVGDQPSLGSLVTSTPSSSARALNRAEPPPSSITGPARSQGLTQTGPSTVGAGQAVVDVDPRRVDPEPDQPVVLGGEVLFGGRDPGVADQQSVNRLSVAV